jgi:hypothetical protein
MSRAESPGLTLMLDSMAATLLSDFNEVFDEPSSVPK